MGTLGAVVGGHGGGGVCMYLQGAHKKMMGTEACCYLSGTEHTIN